MPGGLPDCVVFREGIAYIFFNRDSDTKAKQLREKTKHPKSAEGRRYGPSDPHPIGATTGNFFSDGASAVGSFIMCSVGHLTTTPVYNFCG